MTTYDSPRGLRDFPPGAMDMRQNIIATVAAVYDNYAFTSWDGPAFESLDG